MRILFAAVLLSLGVSSNVLAAQSSEGNLDSYIEALRADVRADKVAIITEAMQFNDQESKIFWPVYRKYEADITKVNDQQVKSVKEFNELLKNKKTGDLIILTGTYEDFPREFNYAFRM